ncbi:MAG TPA: recombinase RecA [Myxococcaceae bacterium]|nr:recombinase RecA [Myxococcaceae bacterium]
MEGAAARADPAVLERLRERIRTLQAAPRQLLSVLRTGLPPVDGLLPGGGFPLGQVVELWGEPASGRARLAFRAIAEAHRALRLAAWVDGPRTLYAPALPPLGVRLEQLLVIRPPETRQLAWSALQLLRSGAFAAVGLDLTSTDVRLSPPESRRLVEAASRSGGLLLLLTPSGAPADGTLRLHVSAAGPHAMRLEVVRSRQGSASRAVEVPWELLTPGGPSDVGAGNRGLDAPPVPDEPSMPFRRVRACTLRDGLVGIQGQRPGRDLPLPSFAQALGIGT